MKRLHLLYPLCLSLALTGCAVPTQAPLTDTLSARIQGLEQHPGADISLYSKVHFDQAVTLLGQNSPTLPLLVFLRGYSYFGDMDSLAESDYRFLALQLAALAKNNRHTQGSAAGQAIQEQLAVVGYRFFSAEGRGEEIQPFINLLGQQLTELGSASSSRARDYALWETLRAYGFLLNEARKNPQSNLNRVLRASDAKRHLLEFATSPAALAPDGDWPKMNAYWALAQYRLVLADEAGKTSAPAAELDNLVRAIATADAAARPRNAKDAYTLGYHVNRFGGKAECEQDSLCQIPSLTEVLPQRHECSDSLYILSQDLTDAELTQSCNKLTSQEQDFHQLLNTGKVATANDNNHSLQVVAFKNWSQYNAYGQLLFDIGTDNGGMYIEGTPSKPGNQASFFAFRQWWIAPEFAIWNLNHEYVHYLDGRFVKYGGFEHFPAKMVWWAEGVGEYISRGKHNPDALKLAATKRAETPSLATIFATEYPDGLERTYRWSYLVVRYLAEHHQAHLVALSQHLKTDYFEGYTQLLDDIAAKEQANFTLWLTNLLNEEQAATTEDSGLPRKINRYAYRDYLHPQHLQNEGLHFHY